MSLAELSSSSTEGLRASVGSAIWTEGVGKFRGSGSMLEVN